MNLNPLEGSAHVAATPPSRTRARVESDAPRESRCWSFAKLVTRLLAVSAAAAAFTRGFSAPIGNSVVVAGPGPGFVPPGSGPIVPVDPLPAVPQPLAPGAPFRAPDASFEAKGRRKSKVPPKPVKPEAPKPPEQELLGGLFKAGVKRVFVLELHRSKGNDVALSTTLKAAKDAGVQAAYYREVESDLDCESMERGIGKPRPLAKVVHQYMAVQGEGDLDRQTRKRRDGIAEMVNDNGGAKALCFKDSKFSMNRALRDPQPAILNMGYAHGMGRWLGRNRVAYAQCDSELAVHTDTAAFAQLDDATQRDAFDGVSRAARDGGVVVVVPRTMWGTRQACSGPSGVLSEFRYDRTRIGQEFRDMGFSATDAGDLTIFASSDLQPAVRAFDARHPDDSKTQAAARPEHLPTDGPAFAGRDEF